METGKGIRIQDAYGNQLIDGFAGLYCVNVGYGRTEVAEAISRQAYRLAYYHSYAAHDRRTGDPVGSSSQNGAGQDE